ncbi:MAG: hypothetical protein QM784_05600 [Polyangiaceae bacterium]
MAGLADAGRDVVDRGGPALVGVEGGAGGEGVAGEGVGLLRHDRLGVVAQLTRRQGGERRALLRGARPGERLQRRFAGGDAAGRGGLLRRARRVVGVGEAGEGAGPDSAAGLGREGGGGGAGLVVEALHGGGAPAGDGRVAFVGLGPDQELLLERQ